MKTIYFDMDGTIVDLYGVNNWLEKLRAEDFSPYEDANPLIDVHKLSEILLVLKSKGYKLGIITWGSKYSSEKFIKQVRISKEKWLNKYLPDIIFDEFVVTDYSCNKASNVEDPFGILFDDSKFIRAFWPGDSYPPEAIFPVLEKLIKGEKDFESI